MVIARMAFYLLVNACLPDQMMSITYAAQITEYMHSNQVLITIIISDITAWCLC